MQVLILDDDTDRIARLVPVLAVRGIGVLCVESLRQAEAMVRLGLPDLLLMVEQAGDRLSHSVALLAGCREPAVPAVFITSRQGAAAAELFDLIPSAVALVGPGTREETVAEIVQAALSGAPVPPLPPPDVGRVASAAAQPGRPVAGVPGSAGRDAPRPCGSSPPDMSGSSRAERARALARLPSRRPALTLA